jgi:hypothetical protein
MENTFFFKGWLKISKVKYEIKNGIKTLRKKRKATYNLGFVVVLIHLKVSNRPR